MMSHTYSSSPAVPPLDFPAQRSHYVFVPVNGTVSTELTCDIEPGTARESYSIKWFQIYPKFALITKGINEKNFNLTLAVDVNSSGAVYMCTVTIDHDGTTFLYSGAEITLRTGGKTCIHTTPYTLNVAGSCTHCLPTLHDVNRQPCIHTCMCMHGHVGTMVVRCGLLLAS